jgi:hypothetical protein
MEKNKQFAFIIIIVVFLLNMYGLLAASEMSIDLEIDVIKHASEPKFYGNSVILTYEDPRPVRSVGAIFDHEGYRTLHLYNRNKHNIFCLVYHVPPGIRDLTYRLVVDGLVTEDPNNPDSERNLIGVTFSRVEIPERHIPRTIRNPEIKGQDSFLFTYRALPGKIVSISGDFNAWDPFLDLFTEISPGTYTVVIRVSPGEHYYIFFVNGEKRLDPFNPRRKVSDIGEEVSSFVAGR